MTSSICIGRGTFARGIHPPDNKAFAADVAIEVLPTPAEVNIPLSQHIGAPAKQVVAARAVVQVGETLGEAGGFVSAPVHASVAGTVGRETMVDLPGGRRVPAIPIKTDPEKCLSGRELLDDVYGGDYLSVNPNAHQPKDIMEAANDSGLVGLGGAAFPTHVKLARNEQKPCAVLLINGAECEPYLTADYRLMLEFPGVVVMGALLAKQAVGADEVVICVEDNKPKAVEALKKAAADTEAKVRSVHTKYPQGGEKQLINAVTGRVVPTGGLPRDIGCVVSNVATVAALARAVVHKKPLTHRIVTVSGAGIKTPKNLLVPLGVSCQELIDYCGGLTEDAARIISGGPMMGYALGSLDIPVTKGTSGLTVLTHADVTKATETNCVRCGRCVDNCPLRLVPTKLALAARAGNVEIAQAYHLTACMECGCCAYVCPANLPLVQLIRVGKGQLRKAQAAKKD